MFKIISLLKVAWVFMLITLFYVSDGVYATNSKNNENHQTTKSKLNQKKVYKIESKKDNTCKTDDCFANKLMKCTKFSYSNKQNSTISYDETIWINWERDGKCEVFFIGRYSSKDKTRSITYRAECLISKDKPKSIDTYLLSLSESVRAYVRGRVEIKGILSSIENYNKYHKQCTYSVQY